MLPRILSLKSRPDIINELRSMNVDEYGIKIMSPKADFYLIKLSKVSSVAANILKQEMLSLGGEAAISRQSITGKGSYTDCLLIGNFVQLNNLINKLKIQPFKLNEIGMDIKDVLTDYKKDRFVFRCRNKRIEISNKSLIMGIINVTSDSFSGDGILANLNFRSKKELESFVVKMAERLTSDGVDIIDIGAESTRPGAKPVSSKVELERISFCIKTLAKRFRIPISVDTYKPEVARVALDLGASIINDITGLRNDNMRKVVSKYKAGVIIMHMKGNPRIMQVRPCYKSLIEEIIGFLKESMDLAIDSGIKSENIIVDPGIGFGKTFEHNLEILKNLGEFKILGRPILVGVSRKSFIGKINSAKNGDRVFGTAAAVALAIKEGANILRVHDVKEMLQVAKTCDTILRGKL